MYVGWSRKPRRVERSQRGVKNPRAAMWELYMECIPECNCATRERARNNLLAINMSLLYMMELCMSIWHRNDARSLSNEVWGLWFQVLGWSVCDTVGRCVCDLWVRGGGVAWEKYIVQSIEHILRLYLSKYLFWQYLHLNADLCTCVLPGRTFALRHVCDPSPSIVLHYINECNIVRWWMLTLLSLVYLSKHSTACLDEQHALVKCRKHVPGTVTRKRTRTRTPRTCSAYAQFNSCAHE